MTGHGKRPLKLKKKPKLAPTFFLQPCGALNFGLTGLAVTRHGKGPLKFKKNGKIVPTKCFCSHVVPLILVLRGWKLTEHGKGPLKLKKKRPKLATKNFSCSHGVPLICMCSRACTCAHARICACTRACVQALICRKLDLSSSISYRTIILGIFFQIQLFYGIQDTHLLLRPANCAGLA